MDGQTGGISISLVAGLSARRDIKYTHFSKEMEIVQFAYILNVPLMKGHIQNKNTFLDFLCRVPHIILN